MAGEHGAGGGRTGGGGGGGDAYEFALVDALGGLSPGADEPPMPDLLPGAVSRGRRIRRRRRAGVALGAAAAVVAVAAGGYAALLPPPQTRSSVPAVRPSVWYPSLALLRTVVPAEAGTVDAAGTRPADRSRPYYRLRDASGAETHLYVSVARSVGGGP
ncbi:hypothetical protein ACWD25_58905, partial [Streptomyces sp. NPDC002920]